MRNEDIDRLTKFISNISINQGFDMKLGLNVENQEKDEMNKLKSDSISTKVNLKIVYY